ncbi:MAG: polysaccharide biosynthesis/export family protein, partial [Acidobacteriota bacterium]
MSQTFSRLRECTRWLLAVFCFLPWVTQFAFSVDAQGPGQNGDTETLVQIQGIAGVVRTETPAYRIGVEDVLFISVWREPDLTREVPVRPDGKISLPLIQDVHAAGKTPAELSQEIDSKLRAFLSSPAVTVVVREVNSLKVYL